MRKRTIENLLLAILLITAAGCAALETSEHKYYMRGQVLEVRDGTAFLCIGSEEGAKIGQVFTVHRYVNVEPRRQAQPHYRIDFVGMVKITEIESHMASAKIIDGDIQANDVVELKQ